MDHGSYRDTWVEVSLDAIKSNVKSFKKHIQEKTMLMAVVKADGYGHGAVHVANAAIQSGAGYIGVAFLDEALKLREAGIVTPILVLGYTSPAAVSEAVKNDITFTIYSDESVPEIRKAAKDFKKQAKVHLKIDTGMSRIGIRDRKEALKVCQSLNSSDILLEGIFTHFADADNVDSTYTYKQFENFNGVIKYLEDHHVKIPIKHCCNSAGTIAYPDMHMDMVRVGISLYGLYPSSHLQDKIKLKQAMTFRTKPVMIKPLEAGEPISYGCTYVAKESSTIATLPVGYADGFSRQLSNKGRATVNGVHVPIVGRICMDQTMIDVSSVESLGYDDVVTLFGDPEDGYISLGEVADQMNTIHYETVCLIGKRVPRVYTQDGEFL
ncbi:alanine racemase [Oceanobacillus damuensis]|uniref:alanine racemase n=1 Tax=Oceanobacillus damuensis TaxID=937928 RepID=UPI000829F839|nr:alanine racemase [Oceanobacillus damuensis]